MSNKTGDQITDYYDTSDPQNQNLDEKKFKEFLNSIVVPQEFAILDKQSRYQAVLNYLFDILDNKQPSRFFVHGVHNQRLVDSFDDKVAGIEDELMRIDPDAEANRRLGNLKNFADEYTGRNDYDSILGSLAIIKRSFDILSVTPKPELETELKTFESTIRLSAVKRECELWEKVINEYAIKPDTYLRDRFPVIASVDALHKYLVNDNRILVSLDDQIFKKAEDQCTPQDKKVLNALLVSLNDKLTALWNKLTILKKDRDTSKNES